MFYVGVQTPVLCSSLLEAKPMLSLTDGAAATCAPPRGKPSDQDKGSDDEEGAKQGKREKKGKKEKKVKKEKDAEKEKSKKNKKKMVCRLRSMTLKRQRLSGVSWCFVLCVTVLVVVVSAR